MPAHRTEWFKSSYSAQNGDCVETRHAAAGSVDLRDSKDPQGPVLTFPEGAWAAFVAGVRAGDFPAAA